MKKFFWILILGAGIGVVISLSSAEMIERTAGVAFCSSCHSMKGVSLAYEKNIHGGNNAIGFRARCVDCHLPHDNVGHYVVAKAYSGAKDVLGEMFWADSFDWLGNLKKRKEFVYTSGCLQCHDLDAIRYEIPKAFLAHREFKMGIVTSCVQCHEHEGHSNIKDYIHTN